jgi:epoxide hydrolase-like predicted phosphatase
LHTEESPVTSDPPITAVVFDFGGVLITPITELLAEIADWHDVAMVDILGVLMGPRETSTADHPWHRAERGELPTTAMQREVVPFAEAAGIDLRGDEYERLLCGVFEVHDEVVDRIGRLRGEGYRTGLLTNSFVEFRPHLEQRIDFSIFDVVVDSSEVGCRKPEPRIYELTGAMVGEPAAQILYLDDFEANLVGARAAGWKTIHVTGRDHIVADIDAALGLVCPHRDLRAR